MVVSRKREEAVIRRLIEDWAAAVRARKISAVVAHHTDDVVMFDVPPPVVVRGISAYRKTWAPFFGWQKRGERHIRHRQVGHHGWRHGCVRHGLAAVWVESGAGKEQPPAPASNDRATQGSGHVEDRPRASLLPGGRVACTRDARRVPRPAGHVLYPDRENRAVLLRLAVILSSRGAVGGARSSP